MTIMFDNRGTDPYLKSVGVKDGFTVNEQSLLMAAMIATVECSERVQEVGKSRFNDLLDYWFGLKPDQSDFEDNVDCVVYGINMIHAVLSDNKKIITFVDRRNE